MLALTEDHAIFTTRRRAVKLAFGGEATNVGRDPTWRELLRLNSQDRILPVVTVEGTPAELAVPYYRVEDIAPFVHTGDR
jgi:hypothetical protein